MQALAHASVLAILKNIYQEAQLVDTGGASNVEWVMTLGGRKPRVL